MQTQIVNSIETKQSPSATAQAAEIDFSLVVCTFNRHKLLQRCLQSLLALNFPRSRFEVIVIDNNSTDATRQVVADFPTVKYFFERQQGLSFARNRGSREARGRYIAYLDDEALVSVDWLENAALIVRDVAPDVFGGPYHPWYPEGKPVWFKDSYQSNADLLGSRARPMQPGEFLSGTNFFIRRELFSIVGGFDPGLGMKGGTIGYGEEVEFQNAVRRLRPQTRFYYDPTLLVHHGVRSHKMKLSRMARDNFISGRHGYLSRPGWPTSFREARTDVGVLLVAASKLVTAVCCGFQRRDRRRHQFFQNYIYEEVLIHLLEIGHRYERIVRWIARNRSQVGQH